MGHHSAKKGSHVYVARADGIAGLKIGMSSVVERRLRAISNMVKCPLSLLYRSELTVLAARIEMRAHQLLEPRRLLDQDNLGVEWFDVDLAGALDAIERARGDVASGWKWPPRLGRKMEARCLIE